MQNPIPQLAKYGMGPKYGFLPPELPSTRLPSPCFSPWEALLANLPQLIAKKRIRGLVQELPILSTCKLTGDSEWQRAYTVLCFIAHAYIWGDSPAAERLPASISIPLLDVCAHLGTLPVTTYAALCLWNFQPLLPDQQLDNPDNLVALHTFTGTADESWFHIISVAIEARGAPLVPTLLGAIEHVRREDTAALTVALTKAASILAELGPLLQRMHEHLNPQVFYNDIRPFLAGSKSLPKGILFDDGSGEEKFYKYSGGSAAQSSLFPFCDIVLGVQHGKPGNDNAGAKEFVAEMRYYMPSQHRRLLEDVAAVTNVKEFVQRQSANIELNAAYIGCLERLRAFRDKHIGIVSRYIVIPSKAAAKAMRTEGTSTGEEMTGTGGAPLIPFLKQMRDETTIS